MHAFFMAMGSGTRFCIVHAARGSSSGALLFVHPFAEEMNRCRRMASLQARALAQAGWTVLQMDLCGCGDSSGDFGDANWQRWLDDLEEGRSWLERETGHTPGFWGLRAGCLLAAQAARSLAEACPLIFWQPTLSGKQHLQQFLRLDLGAHIVSQAEGAPTGVTGLREQLARGEPVEVIGYTISPAMAAGMDGAALEPPLKTTRVAWLEVQGTENPDLGAASKMHVQHWKHAGHDVHARAVRGPAFWQTPEITECAALIGATLAAVRSWI